MKPNPEQQYLIEKLAAKHKQYKIAELTVAERIREQVEKELNVLLVERSQIANEAHAAGVSKTRIGRALMTSDWGTVRSVLELAGGAAAPEAVEANFIKGDGWIFNKETFKLELTAWPHRHLKRTEKRLLVIPMHRAEGSRFDPATNDYVTVPEVRPIDYAGDVYKQGVETDTWYPAVIEAIEVGLGWKEPEEQRPAAEEPVADPWANVAQWASDPDAYDEEEA